MLTAAGGLLVAAALLGAGIKRAAGFRRRERLLSELGELAAFCRERIRYAGTERSELLKEGLQRFPLAAEAIEGESRQALGYSESIGKFLSRLGSSDRESQLELCRSAESFFSAERDKQRARVEKDGRVSIALGVFSAAALLLMLI